ncbi:hypothetical protein Pcinc_005077 [Petrolisthes cinctipes]|uniref:Uncharacterized protein n=1 Tax=Petrolisthes cinctipes TaxID=88211 RepID=A0AAE1L338_PETCI|nr:hypothetical protein Pcinc_005077 [Petrolisthes cinctipes]
MLDHKSTFDGTFHEGCIELVIPLTLLQFVAMLEHGADMKSQLRFGVSKTYLTIAQLLQYNCYAGVLKISAQLRNATVCKSVEDGVVCPLVLRKGLCTTSAMGNIDHNPTATTSTNSFHGTSVSVFQHSIKEDKGEERGQLQFGEEKVKIVPKLPDSFTNVRPAFFNMN